LFAGWFIYVEQLKCYRWANYALHSKTLSSEPGSPGCILVLVKNRESDHAHYQEKRQGDRKR
jgi:hypothetical protein